MLLHTKIPHQCYRMNINSQAKNVYAKEQTILFAILLVVKSEHPKKWNKNGCSIELTRSAALLCHVANGGGSGQWKTGLPLWRDMTVTAILSLRS